MAPTAIAFIILYTLTFLGLQRGEVGNIGEEGDAAGVVVHAAAVMAQPVGYHKPGHAEHHVVAHDLVENLLGQPD